MYSHSALLPNYSYAILIWEFPLNVQLKCFTHLLLLQQFCCRSLAYTCKHLKCTKCHLLILNCHSNKNEQLQCFGLGIKFLTQEEKPSQSILCALTQSSALDNASLRGSLLCWALYISLLSKLEQALCHKLLHLFFDCWGGREENTRETYFFAT